MESVPLQDLENGFYSTFFLVPKKTGEMRPVINLRPLNRYLRKQHFKMDTLKSAINLVRQGDWAISLDLKDAYMHIPINKLYRKYLRFCVKGNPCLQFKALPFGPTSAPRIFTKVVSVVAAHLRAQGIRLIVYLDDWFIVNPDKIQLLSDRKKIINLLVSLGFIINLTKSTLVPTQHIVYLGAVFRLDLGIILPTQERVLKFFSAVKKIQTTIHVTALDFLQVLGIMASCLEIVPNARLYMRPIQMHLLKYWRPASQIFDAKIPVTKSLKSHLNWWLDTANITKGKSFQQWECQSTITTDASSTHGWGGSLGNTDCAGNMDKSGKTASYQLSGDGSCNTHTNSFSGGSERSECTYTVRQFDCSAVYKQTRGHSLNSVMSENIRSLAPGNSKSDSVKVSSHSGEIQCFSRHVIQDQNTSHRVVPEYISSTSNFSTSGISTDRSFCLSREQENSDILLVVSPPKCTSSGRSFHSMGEHVRICISTNMSHTKSTSSHVSVQMSDNSCSSSLAKKTLVSRPVKNANRFSNKTSKSRKSALPEKGKHKSS